MCVDIIRYNAPKTELRLKEAAETSESSSSMYVQLKSLLEIKYFTNRTIHIISYYLLWRPSSVTQGPLFFLAPKIPQG